MSTTSSGSASRASSLIADAFKRRDAEISKRISRRKSLYSPRDWVGFEAAAESERRQVYADLVERRAPLDEWEAAERRLGAHGVEVLGCRCNSPACPYCSHAVAQRRVEQFEGDCVRLGVEWISTVAVTVDSKRFGDGRHVVESRVASRLMDEVWSLFPAGYRKRWGCRPVWWCAREVHDGKRLADGGDGSASGRLHLHIYFPAASKSGRVSRRLLDGIREAGIRLSGRTTYGWVRSKAYAASVHSVAGYASKAMSYAGKGSEVPADILDSVRCRMWTRSQAVTDGDPKCVERRQRDAEKRRVRAPGPQPGARRRLRPHRERVADCMKEVRLHLGSEYSQAIPVPLAKIHDAFVDTFVWPAAPESVVPDADPRKVFPFKGRRIEMTAEQAAVVLPAAGYRPGYAKPQPRQTFSSLPPTCAPRTQSASNESPKKLSDNAGASFSGIHLTLPRAVSFGGGREENAGPWHVQRSSGPTCFDSLLLTPQGLWGKPPARPQGRGGGSPILVKSESIVISGCGAPCWSIRPPP